MSPNRHSCIAAYTQIPKKLLETLVTVLLFYAQWRRGTKRKVGGKFTSPTKNFGLSEMYVLVEKSSSKNTNFLAKTPSLGDI